MLDNRRARAGHPLALLNASVAQFENGGVCDIVAAALKATGRKPRRLELEVHREPAARDSEAIMAELHALKAMGVAIVMDDFGTGYSSLSYLWRFPFDKLQIDRSFMTGLDLRPGCRDGGEHCDRTRT
jgi:EAL domain-containing protein (putative c-di-GMP-specific phosphodiesterase class I)